MSDDAEFDGRERATRDEREAPAQQDSGPARMSGAVAPDVSLHVPDLRVEEIKLDVQNLRAQLSLQAQVLDLVTLNVGADVDLDRVAVEIQGTQAAPVLEVRLGNVADILERVLTTIDRNPQIVQHLRGQSAATAGEIAHGAGDAATGDEAGQADQRGVAGELGSGGDRSSGSGGDESAGGSYPGGEESAEQPETDGADSPGEGAEAGDSRASAEEAAPPDRRPRSLRRMRTRSGRRRPLRMPPASHR